MGEMKAVSYNMLYEIDDLRNMKRGGRSTEGLLGNIVLRDQTGDWEELNNIMSWQGSFLVTDNLGGDDGTRLPSHCALLLFVFLLLIYSSNSAQTSQSPYSVVEHHLVGICYFFAIRINR